MPFSRISRSLSGGTTAYVGPGATRAAVLQHTGEEPVLFVGYRKHVPGLDICPVERRQQQFTDTDQQPPTGSPFCPCSPVTFSECFELWRAVRWLSVSLSFSLSLFLLSLFFLSFFKSVFLFLPILSLFSLNFFLPLVFRSDGSRASSPTSERVFFRWRGKAHEGLLTRDTAIGIGPYRGSTPSRDRRAGFLLDVRLNRCFDCHSTHFVRTRWYALQLAYASHSTHQNTYLHVTATTLLILGCSMFLSAVPYSVAVSPALDCLLYVLVSCIHREYLLPRGVYP